MTNITAIRAQKEAAALSSAARLSRFYGDNEMARIMQNEAAYYYSVARDLLSGAIIEQKTSRSFELAAKLALDAKNQDNYVAFKKRAENHAIQGRKLLGVKERGLI